MIRWLSGEWMLEGRSNGGTIVFLRASWVAGMVWCAAIVVSEVIRPETSWGFSSQALREAALRTWSTAVAVFAFSYAAFYARFASQWSYLAGVYNQILAAKVRGTPKDDPVALSALHAWQAGFVEDAEELHLATKPMFAAVIISMMDDAPVRAKFIEATAGGTVRLERLESRVRAAYDKAALRYGVPKQVAHSNDESNTPSESTG